MKKILALFLLLAWSLWPAGGRAQSRLPIGDWQVHVPHNRAVALAPAGNKIYTATQDGFFSFDREYQQLQVLSKKEGFSGGRISTLAYDAAAATLLIAYDNTLIDLVQEGQVLSLPDIYRKNIPGRKQIYHVFIHNQLAYLSCSFGVVVLDLVRREVRETYSNLGRAGQPLEVYASTILHDSLYLATSDGLMAARQSQNNLLDYRNWRTFTVADGLPAAVGGSCRSVAAFNGKVYAGVNGQGIYRYNGRSWSPTALVAPGRTIWQLLGTAGYLQAIDGEQLILLDKSGARRLVDGPQVQQPRAAFQDPDGTFWIADDGQGLVKLSGSQTEAFYPNGPMFNSAFRVYSDSKEVLVLGGGYDQVYLQRHLSTGFSVWRQGQWESYNPHLYPDPAQFPPLMDLVGAVRNPVNKKLYVSSYGYGLLEWEGLGKFKVYHPDNSPLRSALPGNNAYTRVPALAADAAGNIWMTNRHQLVNTPGLHVLKTDGSWQSFSFPGFADGGNLEKIILDHQGYKWMSVSRKPDASSRGLLVFDDRANRYRHLGTEATAGNLPGADIHALALDRNGFVWVGTDKGVAVFYEPEQVFESRPVAAEMPLIGGRPLLENQVVRAIAVDGGNRKWIGTDNGLWLFNEAGDEVIAHFTSANSFLPADNILDIGIHHGTGEVFIVTAAGLVSYRGQATVTEGQPDCAQVFPNPVRPGYTGLVGLSGLPQDAIVKITDISGALVYQTRAAGGMVTWDLKDLNGQRVRSGVYLAFSATADGRQHCLSKIAVVN